MKKFYFFFYILFGLQNLNNERETFFSCKKLGETSNFLGLLN